MLGYTDKKFIASWEKTLKRGWVRYYLIFGTMYALWMFIFVTLFDLAEKSFVEAYFSKMALLKLLLWEIPGIVIIAPFNWWQNNKRYKKLMEGKP